MRDGRTGKRNLGFGFLEALRCFVGLRDDIFMTSEDF